MKAILAGMCAVYLGTGIAVAQDVPVELAALGTSQVTLHVHGFLTEEELTVLRLVTKDATALALFVPADDGFAAMAASPDDGFIRAGVPVSSAVALSGLPDAEAAQTAALAACDAARSGTAPCVLVLEIAPAS